MALEFPLTCVVDDEYIDPDSVIWICEQGNTPGPAIWARKYIDPTVILTGDVTGSGIGTVDTVVGDDTHVHTSSTVTPYGIGALDSTDPIILGGTIKEVIYNLIGLDLNPSNGSIQYKTLTAPVILTESIQDGECITLRLVNGITHGVTWPVGISWIKELPTLTDADVLVFWSESGVTYGNYCGAYV